jgi:alpha-D-ribose 1-methylphosphonate 5-triphosphate synthase subunit PhnH
VPIVQNPAEAGFVLSASWRDLGTLRAGSHETPEESATLILQIAALGSGNAYRLNGPGLAQPALLHAAGLPEHFVAAWQRNHAQFPRGIDIMLCAGDRLAALPRSVMVEAA